MVLRNEGHKAERQIRSRYQEYVRSHAAVNERDVAQRRTLNELRDIVKESKEARMKQKALDRERKLAERERIRREYLAKIVDNFAQWWQKASAYAEEKNASAYDSVRNTIVDLHDAYEQAGRLDEFTEIFEEFISKYSRRPALLRRLKEAGLPGL